MKFENENDLKLYSDYEHDVDTFLTDVEKKKLIENLNVIQVEYIDGQNNDRKRQFHLSKWIMYSAAAAVLVLLIGIAGVIKFSIFKTSVEGTDIFSAYYSAYVADDITRSDEISTNELSSALKAYSEGDFAKTSSILKTNTFTGSKLNEAQFYYGLASIEQADYQVAIDAFNKVLSNAENPYIAQSHWYLALTWLKLNNYTAAREHLLWLQQNDRFYGKKAKEVLNKISEK